MRMGRSMWAVRVVAVVAAGTFVCAGAVAAQAPKADQVAGTWEGVSKGTNGEVPVKLDLQVADGKITGTIGTPGMVIAVTDGKLDAGVVTLTMDAQGMIGTMTGTLAGDRIEATWQVASESGSVTLTRAPASAVATGDGMTGTWTGEAMVQGQPMPITLYLKAAGDVVSGEIESPMGRVALTSGSWKDGVLTVAFPYAGGEPVTMGGKLQEGKLGGMFDYNSGEIQGSWWAARK